MADRRTRHLPTSSANYSCLLHSIIPHLIRNDQLLNRVAQDQALLDELQDYWQLGKAVTSDDFKYLFREFFTARQDQEIVLGPVLRSFLCKQMRLYFDQWKERAQVQDIYRKDTGNLLAQPDCPNFVRGFVEASCSGEQLGQLGIESFSQYLHDIIGGNQYLGGKDILILQERWNFYWEFISQNVDKTVQLHIDDQLYRLQQTLGNIAKDLGNSRQWVCDYEIIDPLIREVKSLQATIGQFKNQSVSDEQLQIINNKVEQVRPSCTDCNPNTQSRFETFDAQLKRLNEIRHKDRQTLNNQEEDNNLRLRMEAVKQEPAAQNKDVTICSYYTGRNHFDCLVPPEYVSYYQQQHSRLIDDNHNLVEYDTIPNKISGQLSQSNMHIDSSNIAQDGLYDKKEIRAQYQKLYEQWQEWQNDPDKQAILEAEDHKAASKNLPRDYQPSQFIGHFFRCNNLNEQQDNILYEDGKGCKASANEQDANYSEDYKLALQLQEEEIEQFFETTQAETDYSKTPG